MTVRLARPEDRAAWTHIWLDSAYAGFGPLLPEGHEYPTAPPGLWEQLLADPDVAVLVDEDEDGLLGYVGCGTNRDSDAPPEAGEVRSMFVASWAWRRGVGRALMDAALDDLRERGYTAAVVWSFADNERANAFYERMGFARDGGERSNEAWAHIPEVRYRRNL